METMTRTPIDAEVVDAQLSQLGIRSVAQASIREIKRLVDGIEAATGERFVRMEMGIPGLPPMPAGVEAQIAALREGVAALYPDIQGLPELKQEMARFARLFLDLEVAPERCLPTVGSTMASMACFLTVNRMYAQREGTLFLDPGFPVHKQQCKVIGHGCLSFDVYDYRGERLRAKLLSYLETGKVSSILYSNPNNPAWICFTEEELAIIGELANRFDVVVMEDLAYFGMDFRKDYGHPGTPPFQPTVARYAEQWVLLVSSSKVFSYAGERIGMLVVSEALWNKRAPDLRRYFASDLFSHALVFGTLYSLCAGTSHSPQRALTAMLRAVNDGRVDLLEAVHEYGEKARLMKRMFVENGFRIVYDRDLDQPIADGFYFTFAYPGLDGEHLVHELLYYGISAITLGITGSERTEGLRACTSLVRREQLPVLEERLVRFHADHRG